MRIFGIRFFEKPCLFKRIRAVSDTFSCPDGHHDEGGVDGVRTHFGLEKIFRNIISLEFGDKNPAEVLHINRDSLIRLLQNKHSLDLGLTYSTIKAAILKAQRSWSLEQEEERSQPAADFFHRVNTILNPKVQKAEKESREAPQKAKKAASPLSEKAASAREKFLGHIESLDRGWELYPDLKAEMKEIRKAPLPRRLNEDKLKAFKKELAHKKRAVLRIIKRAEDRHRKLASRLGKVETLVRELKQDAKKAKGKASIKLRQLVEDLEQAAKASLSPKKIGKGESAGNFAETFESKIKAVDGLASNARRTQRRLLPNPPQES